MILRYLIMSGIFVVILVVCLSLIGCSNRITGILPPTVAKNPSGKFLAGAAKVDITPMPGIPMGGYSIVGTVGRGYWTRLFARSIYLEDSKGQGFVMVSCDLWSVPAGLGDRIAEIIGQQPETKHLSREQIILAATHTHHSPGNFSTSVMYNEFASYRKGFDYGLFEFFAQRIAQSITESVKKAEAAEIYSNQQVVAKVARNRSLGAFLLNTDRDEFLKNNATLETKKVLHFQDDDYRAVNPTLTTLRIKSIDHDKTIAVASFFATHPTVMGGKTEIYHGDMFGFATIQAEQHFQKQGQETIVALFNGAEGDVSPNWDNRDRKNTVSLGNVLSQAIISCSQQAGEKISTDIAYNYAVIPLASQEFVDSQGVTRKTAEKPLVGVAVLGGATDGRSRLHKFLWEEEVKATHSLDHGSKQAPNNPLRMELPPVIKFVLDKAMGEIHPPKEFPVGVYRLGDIILTTLPGEFTTMLGKRIATSISQTVSCKLVLNIGLGNEFISYFTTPEEYEAQYYEGASNLFGPFAGPWVKHELTRLAQELETSPKRSEEKSYSYNPGKHRTFSLHDVGAEPPLPDDGLGNVLQDLRSGYPMRNYPRFIWQDRLVTLKDTQVTPEISLEIQVDGTWQDFQIAGIPENDRGSNFVTMVLTADQEQSKWCVFWMIPQDFHDSSNLRFKVRKLNGEILHSPAFNVDQEKQ